MTRRRVDDEPRDESAQSASAEEGPAPADAAQQPVAPAAKKAAPKKAAPRKTAAKATPAKKAPAKKAPAKATSTTKTDATTAASSPDEAPVTEAAAKASATDAVKKAPAKKPTGKKTAAAPARKAPAAKSPAAPATSGTTPTSDAHEVPATPGARVARRRAHEHPIQQRVAVVIPAKDEARRIAATVRAARAIPLVDLVLVVDDGSEDDTQHAARDAGAVVVRHSHNRGKASAMETGAAIVAMRDAGDREPRLLLFLDGDLGETAVNAAPLVPPVVERAADMAIAVLPRQAGAGGRGMVVGLARRAIQSMTGWTAVQPLSGIRCLTREAFEAATPLARGWGVETGLTIDLLRQGFVAVEVPCDLSHRPSGNDVRGQLHRAAQYRDVLVAVNARRVRAAAGSIRGRLTPR